MVGDDEWSTNGHVSIRLIAPADLAVPCVDGIDTHLGISVDRVIHDCMERERPLHTRLDGYAPEHCAVLFAQGVGAVIYDTILHHRNGIICKRHGDNPAISMRTPAR